MRERPGARLSSRLGDGRTKRPKLENLKRVDLRHDCFVVERCRIVLAGDLGTAPFAGVFEQLGLCLYLLAQIDAGDREDGVAAGFYDTDQLVETVERGWPSVKTPDAVTPA